MTEKEALGHMDYIKGIIISEVPWTKSVDAINVAIKALEKSIIWAEVEKIQDKVERLTGIHLEQCVEDLIDLDRKAAE